MALNTKADYRNIDVSNIDISGTNIAKRIDGSKELRLEDVAYLAEFYCEIVANESNVGNYNAGFTINDKINAYNLNQIISAIDSKFSREAQKVNFGTHSFVGNTNFANGVKLPTYIGYMPEDFYQAVVSAKPNVLQSQITLGTYSSDEQLDTQKLKNALNALNNNFKRFNTNWILGRGTQTNRIVYGDGSTTTSDTTTTRSYSISRSFTAECGASYEKKLSTKTSSTSWHIYEDTSEMWIMPASNCGATIQECIGILCSIEGQVQNTSTRSSTIKTPLAYVIPPDSFIEGEAHFTISKDFARQKLIENGIISNDDEYVSCSCNPKGFLVKFNYPANWLN